MTAKKLGLIIGFIVLVVGGGILLYLRSNSGLLGSSAAKTAYITVTAAPSDSNVTLNNKPGQLGVNQVAPGTYNVVISHSGFASVTKTVVVAKGQDVPVAFALAPNSAATANWYTTHPQDAATAAAVTEPQYAAAPANPKSAASLASLLPYQIGGDYPFDVVQDPDTDDPTNPLYYIEADTPTAQQNALTWLKNQGYDPSKLDLKYISTTDPMRP